MKCTWNFSKVYDVWKVLMDNFSAFENTYDWSLEALDIVLLVVIIIIGMIYVCLESGVINLLEVF